MATDAQMAHQKIEFLRHFRTGGNVKEVCEAIGLPRRTLYDWRERDEQFAAAYAEAELESLEVLEGELRGRAVSHEVVKVKHERKRVNRQWQMVETERIVTHEGSDTLLMFLLKARAPEKYRERYDVEMSGKGGGAIPLALIDSIVAKADGREA